jgi:potassium/hydrogen antiporter
MTIELILLIAALLVLLSIVASTASNRLGIPALVLFLIIGMLAGSDGPGGIAFDNAWVAQFVGVVALAYILFSGGLDTDWRRIKPVLGAGLVLANLGVIISALLMAGFGVWVLGFSLWQALLFGAIISSTDAAAVFAVMQSRGVNLRGNLEPVIELESGSNDPIAVFLTLGFTQMLITPGASLVDLVPMFMIQMVVGGACGYLMGLGMTGLINRLRLRQEGLYPVLTLALVLLVYGLTTLIGGNGFLAVYLAGIVMGNRSFVHKRSLIRFHEGVAWLMQIVMFLTLGLLVFPSRLLPVVGVGLLVSFFLIFVSRPLSVLVALVLHRFPLAEKFMIAWSGLRGAVPIVLATFPLLAGVPGADFMFHLVFFIVLTSVLVQGTSIGWVAQWLNLNEPTPTVHPRPLEFVPEVTVDSELVEIPVQAGSPLEGRAIVQAGLPPGALVVLVRRHGDTVIPNGGTVIEAGDQLLILANEEAVASVRQQVTTSSHAG